MTVDRAAIARRHCAPLARARMQGSRAIPRVLVAGAKVVVVFSLLALSFSTTYAASPGAFSDSDLLGILTLYTTHSLQLPFALDERAYVTMIRELSEKTGDYAVPRLFAGQSSSPLLDILKKNGYETSTAYDTTTFGKSKGPYVDHHLAGTGPTVCDLLDDRVYAISFWGYCLIVEDESFEKRRRVIGRVASASLRDGPQFAMAYVYVPGHPSRSFQYSDEEQLRGFRAHYRRGSADAAGLLAKLLAHLNEHDPDAILLVFGDHGALLSYNVAFADAPEFVVQDHFGALGGVHPPDACAEWFDEAQEKRGYLTLLDAVHTVIRCLSGGESALRAPPEDYYLGGWNGVVPDGHRRTYKEFLYE